MTTNDPVIASALIAAIGVVLAALLGKLPEIIEKVTPAGKARAETRRANAEAERIESENEMNRAQRDIQEINRLSAEVNRLRKKLIEHHIDPTDSRPGMGQQHEPSR